jgi:hypothetical protein
MSTVTTLKVCDYTRKRFHRPVYLHLLTSSGHLWNSVLIVLSPAIWWQSMELPRKTKETLLKFIIDRQVSKDSQWAGGTRNTLSIYRQKLTILYTVSWWSHSHWRLTNKCCHWEGHPSIQDSTTECHALRATSIEYCICSVCNLM